MDFLQCLIISTEPNALYLNYCHNQRAANAKQPWSLVLRNVYCASLNLKLVFKRSEINNLFIFFAMVNLSVCCVCTSLTLHIPVNCDTPLFAMAII